MLILWVTCHYGSRGSSAIVASCLCCCFEGPKFFLADISWVKRFSKGYFAGPTFFLVGILWVENFFLVGTSWIQSSSRGSFVVQRFSVFGCMRMSDRKQKHINTSKTAYSNCQIDFSDCQFCLCWKGTSSTKLFLLVRSFICTSCIFSRLFLSLQLEVEETLKYRCVCRPPSGKV